MIESQVDENIPFVFVRGRGLSVIRAWPSYVPWIETKYSTRQSPWVETVLELKQGRSHGESEGANCSCGFSCCALFAHAAAHCFNPGTLLCSDISCCSTEDPFILNEAITVNLFVEQKRNKYGLKYTTITDNVYRKKNVQLGGPIVTLLHVKIHLIQIGQGNAISN